MSLYCTGKQGPRYIPHGMGRTTYNKLVRDRIPEIIESRGATAATRVLAEEEVIPALLDKLFEEAQELRAAKAEGRAEELADVLEVLKSLAEALRLSWADIEVTQEQKRAERGGFQKRIFLESTEEA